MCQFALELFAAIPESQTIPIASPIWSRWQHVAALREGRVLVFDFPPPSASC